MDGFLETFRSALYAFMDMYVLPMCRCVVVMPKVCTVKLQLELTVMNLEH